MALSAAEKQRRYRQRRDTDPERRKQYLEKEKARYTTDLATGKRKNAAQMSVREKRITRRRWRLQKKDLKKRKQQLENLVTPPSSPARPTEPDIPRPTRSSVRTINEENTPKSERDKQIAKKTRVAKCFRDLARKTFTIKILQKKMKYLKKRLIREQVKTTTIPGEEDTPRKKTRQVMRTSKKTISRTLLFHHTILAQMKKDQKEGQKYLTSLASGQLLRKYKLRTRAFRTLGCHFRKKSSNNKYLLTTRIRKYVVRFLLRDDVSRLTSGKKSTVTRNGIKKQKRLLCDTMKNLHHKYIAENDLYQISYTFFCRLRPFWIVAPTEKDRQTCLCKLCENSRYLAECLKNNNILDTNNLSELCKLVVCNNMNKDCMYGICKHCCHQKLVDEAITETKEITWNQWISVKESRTFKTGEEKELTLVKKEMKKGNIMTAVNDLENLLKLKLTKHFFNIQHQFQYYKQLKQDLNDNECLIHIDYAENYLGKLHEEIQSVHFGASQPQITLHTGVYFTKNLPGGSTFCTISDSLQHGPTGVWTYLRPLLNDIKEKHPYITNIHFFSDGPVTQYKQKKNFYLLSSEIYELGFEGACWNFHESGHGKGTPDAVGGSLKRTADTLVRCGEDILCAAKFKEALDKSGTNVTLYITDPKEVQQLADKYDKCFQKLKAIPNTMQIHQIKTITSSSVLFRDVSCNCGFNEGPLCKGHDFKERTFNVKPTVRNVDQDTSKTKHQQFDDTILEKELENGMTNVTGSCTGKQENDTGKVSGCPIEEIEDDMEIFTVFSIPHTKESSHDHYFKILEKLRQCKTFNEFKDQCMAIKIKDVQGKERSILECKSTVDQTAMELCPDDIPSTRAIFPTVVRADGDCLPGCGSVFVYGDDSQAIEMRLRIIIELVLNEDYYMDRKQFEVLSSSGKSKDLRKSFAMYSEAFIPGIHLDDQMIIRIYQQEIMSIATPKKYMGMWQIYGLASVLKMNIFSCYPKKGNRNVREDLHRLVQPRSSPIATSPVFIMWSSTRSDMVETHWVPNHFLPILPVDKDSSEHEAVVIECDNDDTNLAKSDDIVDMLFDIQSTYWTENESSYVEEERTKHNQAETNLDEMTIETDTIIEQNQMDIDTSSDGNQIKTETNIEQGHYTKDSENIHTNKDTIFERSQTKTADKKSSNQGKDGDIDHESGVAKKELTVGQFVQVKYEDDDYPGKILKINESLEEIYVQCMKRVNENNSLYFWPRKKDMCWYPFDAVVMNIPPPRLIDGTNQYTMEFQK